ncbi:hypothetical protein [Chryseobacterium sp. CT-SW4]|uniref:hypothetical protein n=1 Tax=Chryseobacterium sp. SW-1 TaxID=3157343 RepID=UPI003B0297FD
MKLFIKILISQSILIGLAFFTLSCMKKAERPQKSIGEEIESKPFPEQDTITVLTEKELISYVQTAALIQPNPHNGTPFDKLDYDKLIAYDFMGDEEIYPDAVNEKEKFVPVIVKQQFLNQQQADRILTALAQKSSYGDNSAACFRPHLGLVFFKGNKKINQISICLSCNNSTAEIDIPAKRHKVFNKGKETQYYLTGFTSSGKAAIVDLCKEINFYYGIDQQKDRK